MTATLFSWTLIAVFLIAGAGVVTALDNGLSRTPDMGYNTWNKWGANIDEHVVKQTADLMVSSGLAAAGYSYLVVDDAWSNRLRNRHGEIEANFEKFPSGMKVLSDYIHSKGLKFGMYSDAGALTCLSYPGSRYNEERDAALFASFDVDYLKYDNCYAPASDWILDRYIAMRDALNATGRPIVFSMCNWGVANPWEWGHKVGNSWRTTEDIAATWESILVNLDSTIGLAKYAGPGGWNDPDILEVGNGHLTINEQRSHFGLWALLKSPLMVGTDLDKLSNDSYKILLAKEVIAVNQDELGVAGDLIWKEGPAEVYAAPLHGGGRAVGFFNRHCIGTQYPVSDIKVEWSMLGYASHEEMEVRDLFAETDIGTATGSLSLAVDIHDLRLVKLQPKKVQGWHHNWRPWHLHRPSSHCLATDHESQHSQHLQVEANFN